MQAARVRRVFIVAARHRLPDEPATSQPCGEVGGRKGRQFAEGFEAPGANHRHS